MVDFEKEGEAIRRGDLTGVSGLHMTSLARSVRDMSLEAEHAARVAGGGSTSDSEDDDDDGSSGGEESFAFRLPGLPGAVIGDAYVPDVQVLVPESRSPGSSGSSSTNEDDSYEAGDEPFVVRFGTKEERKAHKAAVKEANRLKRKENVPKLVKKRKEKLRKATR